MSKIATKTINTILNLKDKFSKPLKQASENTKQMKRQVKLATNTIETFASKANSSFLMVTKLTAGAVTSITGLIGGLAVKSGFSEAIDLEGYRLQLETATKDTKKAAEIMQYSMDLANKTPFEGGELVQGAAKLESMGMAAKKWLPQIGDMAAATNKPFDQAVEAIIDAQAGELERLKEFGITKAKIVEQANKLYKGKTVVNNKGQIVDQQKFNDAMVALMKERFAGGMEKQASTLKGTWSTVTGTAKSALSSIVGIASDGSIKQGSIYEKLKLKIKSVADMFEKWQKDGTLDKISNQVNNTVSKAIEYLGNAVKWLKDNMNWLVPVASGLLATFVAFNVVSKIAKAFSAMSKIIKGVAVAQGALNVVMAMNPIGLIAVAIGVLIAAGIALWKNWDTVKVKAKQLWSSVTGVWGNIKTSITETVGKVASWLDSFPLGQTFLETIRGVVSSVKQTFSGVVQFFKSVFKGDWEGAWQGIVQAFKGQFNLISTYAKAPINAVIDMINGLIEKVNSISVDIPDWMGGGTFGVNIPNIPKFATGTSYAPGGLSLVGERGPELVNLKRGSSVTPVDKTNKILSGRGNVNVYLTIQGNVYDNKDFANQVGDYIFNKIKVNLGNV